MDRDVEHLISNCSSCIVSGKTDQGQRPPPLTLIELPKRPWQKIAIDIVGELSGAPQHQRFIIVVFDLFSRWPEIRFTSTVTSDNIIQFLADLFSRWGLPDEILSDNGRQFISSEFETFLSEHRIKHSKTAVYHPQSNGAVERFNRVLKEGLRTAKSDGIPFDKSVRNLLASYRSTPHSLTGKSPSELFIGRKLTMPLSLAVPSKSKHVSFNPQVQQRVYQKQSQMKSYSDRRRRSRNVRFGAGDWVRVQLPVRNSKLDPVWSAPRKIASMSGHFTARFEDGSRWNVSRLRRSEPPEFRPPALLASSSSSSPRERPKNPPSNPRRSARSRHPTLRSNDSLWY